MRGANLDVGRIVGRGVERASMTEVLRRVARLGSAASIAVVGEPGIGKTTLLGALAGEAASQGRLVLDGRAAEFERDLPFGVFIDAVDAHLASLEPSRVARLGAHAAELAAVFPALEALGGGRAQVLGSDRFRLHREVRSLLERLAAGRGLVLVLDDVHWADAASCELIASLLRRPPDAAVVLALAYRSGQAPPALASALAGATHAATIDRIELGPFTREESELLMPGEGIGSASRELLFHESGGNPFYLEQLARTHRRSPRDAPAAGPAKLGAGEALAAEVPLEVASALTGELATLSPGALAVAQAAAVAGEPFEPDVVALISGMTETDALVALDELLDRELVRSTPVPRQFRFRHPLVRHGVYASIKGGWRITAHTRAAAALAARGAPALVCAPHVEQAASVGDEQAIALLTQAGIESAGRAPATAARWLEAALRLVPHLGPLRARRRELLPQVAAALWAAGRIEDSHAALIEALGHAEADGIATSIELIVACAATENLLGRHADARARLLAARAAVSDPNSRAAGLLELELSGNGALANDFELARESALRAVKSAQAVGDRPLEANSMTMVCYAELMAGRLTAAEEARAAAARLVDAMDDASIAERIDTFYPLGWGEWYLGRYAEAEAHFARGIAVSRATGRANVLVELMVGRASALQSLGRLGEGNELARDSLEAARLSSNPVTLMASHGACCAALIGIGETAAAVRAGEEALKVARAIRGSTVVAATARVAGSALTAAGQAERGIEVMLELLGGPDLPRCFEVMRAPCYEILTMAALSGDHLPQAEDWARRAAQSASRASLLPTRVAADRANAAVLLAAGRAAEAADRALRAATAAAHAGARLDAARARLLAGRALAAAGERQRAGEELRSAEAELSACGARALNAEAVRELRRLGMRVRRAGQRTTRGTDGIASLSGREREVADLATAGKTNREIATDLFLSEKTVESHLSSVFSKLSVRSRTDVARELARAGTAGH